MRPYHCTITADLVQRHAQARAHKHLKLSGRGPKCTAAALWSVLFWAAGRMRSVAAACRHLRKAPSDTAARQALLSTLPAYAELQRRLNRALAGDLPKALRKRPQRVALDLNLQPYYGKPQRDPEEIYLGAHKAGTKQFHAYATAYVIFHGCRWTLALRPVGHSDPWDDVVADLLRQVRKAGVRVRYLLLDRGFYSVAVVRYLQRARCPFVMPAIRRGRKPDHADGPSGTWAFCAWKKSGWGRYTLQDHDGTQRATVDVAVACLRKPPPRRPSAGPAPKRKKKPRRLVWLYAVWGVRPGSPQAVRQAYRSRFGIETSYRQLNQGRARTSTRSPDVRLLLVGLALLLQNVWAWLHWEVLSQPRRGRRRVDLGQLPLQDMLGWLAQVAEAVLGVRTERPSQRPMPT